jgi:hypothetical protein
MGKTYHRHDGHGNRIQKFVSKPEEKRPLGTLTCRWQYNIKLDLKHIGHKGEYWNQWTQERHQQQALVNVVMNIHISLHVQ